MKSLIPFLALVLCLGSCNIYKDIEIEEVRAIRIIKMTAEGIEAEVDLKIYNPNGYNVKLVSVNADLYVNEKDIGDAELARRVTVGKKSNEVHTIQIEGDYTELSGGLLQTLIGGLFAQSINLKIDGTMKGKALFIGKKFFFKVDQDVKLQN